MRAYLFPGQGAQFVGMGKDLYESGSMAKTLFDQANNIVEFDIHDVMFNGTEETLKQTNVTQPVVFMHSVIQAISNESFHPQMVAGHSLGEFSALVAADALSFLDGLQLVMIRANAMQKACELNPSTMAAIIGLEDDVIENICASIDEVVVPANYNSPGQLVISGSHKGIEIACAKLTEAGARRALPLNVGGAFHSPLMEPARKELAEAIEQVELLEPSCPIYQNVSAKGERDVDVIKSNLIKQLTAPVRWTQSVERMLADGATEFIECGPGNVLQGLVKKVDRSVETSHIE